MPDSHKPHLKYNSVEEWVIGEGIPKDCSSIKDLKLRDKYITQYGELRRHLFAKHLATLSEEDQKKFEQGIHPSQSHDFEEEAFPYCYKLSQNLKSMGLKSFEVKLGLYHFDRLVLSVTIDEPIEEEKLKSLPWLFQGFEVKYHPEEIA